MLDVAAGRGPERRAERGDECAGFAIAAGGRCGGHVLALAESDDAVLEPELGSPATEGGAGLGLEEALQCALVRSALKDGEKTARFGNHPDDIFELARPAELRSSARALVVAGGKRRA